MKGVVFNLLEEAVVREFGIDTWEALLDSAGLTGAYTSLGNYSDEEILALVQAAAGALNLTNAQVLRWFGERAMPIPARIGKRTAEIDALGRRGRDHLAADRIDQRGLDALPADPVSRHIAV